MAPPLQKQPSAGNRSHQPVVMPMDDVTNGQAPAKVAVPDLNPANKAVKQENVRTNGKGGHKNDCDIANAAANAQNFRTVGDEQAQENRQEQLTLPPPVCEPETAQDVADGDNVEPEDPATAAERAIHHGFMNQALDMARLSLKTNETPVGCVLVHDGRVIARGMNATNITRNGTRHAELMALTALLSYTPNADVEDKVSDNVQENAQNKQKSTGNSKNMRPVSQGADKPSLTRTYTEQEWGDVDPKDGHIYPYGQKLHPAPRVDRSLISECILYVTVEPCVMCASMLRQFGIKKVYFGAVNDKFGGTGGVFCIHMNSDPANAASVPTIPLHRPVANQLPRPNLPHKAASCASSINGSQDGSAANGGEVKSVNSITFVEPPIPVSNMTMGHGGNVERGFDAEGGWGRDEAVNLLRQFYVQENGRAPVPRKKEGRAARLAAMMESQGMTTEGTALQGLLQQEREALEREKAATAENGTIDTAVEAEAGINGGPVKETAEACGDSRREDSKAIQDQSMPDKMAV
ncbi:tRNA(adenine34) deaminase [Gnomoniopsis smithogilvyi]|uniref:tRNA(Adenine34) deaminase n=1 Tax=Gnomoniopsis smithogilvyi TaxID=1191159 RepID=A0A9W8YIY2_9PEZI|nr:tRNA(adenine34) deaminase [Gnomoniopsis smithogilvyi]